MSSIPRLAVHQRFAAVRLRLLVFYKLSKIRTHEVVFRINVELQEKKMYSPRRILYVDDSENGFASTILLYRDQKGLF